MGLSQRALARKARVPQATISRAERGEVGALLVRNLIRLSRALGLSVETLVKEVTP